MRVVVVIVAPHDAASWQLICTITRSHVAPAPNPISAVGAGCQTSYQDCVRWLSHKRVSTDVLARHKQCWWYGSDES